MKIIDNNTETLKENLISSIQSGSKLSIAASCFSMYAFHELIKQFSELEEFRFVFTTPSFVKNEKRNNSIVSSTKSSEESIYGSTFETRPRCAATDPGSKSHADFL